MLSWTFILFFIIITTLGLIDYILEKIGIDTEKTEKTEINESITTDFSYSHEHSMEEESWITDPIYSSSSTNIFHDYKD